MAFSNKLFCPDTMRSFVYTLPVLLTLLLGIGLSACSSNSPQSSEGEPPPAVNRYVQGDLTARIESAQNSMPRRGSEGFKPPTSKELNQWSTLIGALIESDTTVADSLVEEHFPSYAVIRFTDVETEQQYFLLQEAPSVEKGWGLVVVNPDPARNLAIEVPHPVFDLDTDREGSDAFRKTDARVLLVAGTHRCSNREASPCDGSTGVCDDGNYHVSDMAHYTEAPFQVTHEVFTQRFPDMVAVNLHGNGRDNCEDVFLTNGVDDTSHVSLRELETALAERGVRVGRPANSSCPLVGSTNVQGRLTNGSPNPCTEAASSPEGTFIHVEQRRAFREDSDAYGALIQSLNEVFE